MVDFLSIKPEEFFQRLMLLPDNSSNLYTMTADLSQSFCALLGDNDAVLEIEKLKQETHSSIQIPLVYIESEVVFNLETPNKKIHFFIEKTREEKVYLVKDLYVYLKKVRSYCISLVASKIAERKLNMSQYSEHMDELDTSTVKFKA